MGFGDKLGSFKQKVGDKIKDAKLDEKFADVKKQMADSVTEFKEKSAENKALANETKAPVEGAIIRYQVIYKGGFEQKPQKKSDSLSLGLNVLPDKFVIKPELLAKEQWFGDTLVEVPYTSVKKFEIVKRQVSMAEAMLSSNGDTKSLEQENNIEITFLEESGKERKLRMEMLTGLSVYGQAAKCREMLDLLREHEILAIFERNMAQVNTMQANAMQANMMQANMMQANAMQSNVMQVATVDIAEQISKLAALKEQGILSEEEFAAKKTELLAKM